MTVRMRVMTASDIADAVRLKDSAGWNQTALDWERFLSACPEGCFVARFSGLSLVESTVRVATMQILRGMNPRSE